jgi:two-component system nitrate/nitrite response regulator NarL
MSEHCSVIIIDDHPLLRRGVGDLIEMSNTLVLAGAAASGEEGVELIREQNPDLVLLDLNMKGMDGIDTLKTIKQEEFDCRVIMLTVSDSEEDVVAALRAGADGYLLKDMEPEEILAQLESAAAGEMAISTKLTQLLAHALRQDARPESLDEAGMTQRETEILAIVAAGKSNKLIARELDITEGTVKVHVKNLLKKLHLKSRVEAAVWAVEHNAAKSQRKH